MKEKKFKMVSIAALLIITVLIGTNIDKIRFGLSLLDIYKNTNPDESISSSIEKDTVSKTPVENPLEKILDRLETVDKVESSGDIEDNANINEAKNSSTDKEEDAPKNNNMNVENPILETGTSSNAPVVENVQRSLKSITEEYNKEFIALQSEFEKTLNSLISEAYNQYKSGQYSNSKLADIYLEKGVELEKSADNRFFGLLKMYEDELKENSHDTSIVKEVKTYYENFKKERKSEMITKGMEMVKK